MDSTLTTWQMEICVSIGFGNLSVGSHLTEENEIFQIIMRLKSHDKNIFSKN